MREYYDNNEDFKTYVDKYCQKNRITVDEALSHESVRQVYLYYQERGRNNEHVFV